MRTSLQVATILRVILFLVILLNLVPTPQLTAETPISREKSDRNDNVQAETDALLSFFDQMPPVPVFLKEEPIIVSGTNTERAVAYTDCAAHDNPTITVKESFYQKANHIQIVNILKHELTHAWLCRQELMSGHDARFRQKFAQVGGIGN